MAGPGIAAGFAPLIALRIAQPIRLGIQQRVQRLLHAAADDTVQVVLDPLIVNRDDIAQRTRCSLSHGGSLLAGLVAFSHLQFSQIRGPASPTQLCERFCTSSAWTREHDPCPIGSNRGAAEGCASDREAARLAPDQGGRTRGDGDEETLTYYVFPEEHLRRIRTNNPLERILR